MHVMHRDKEMNHKENFINFFLIFLQLIVFDIIFEIEESAMKMKM